MKKRPTAPIMLATAACLAMQLPSVGRAAAPTATQSKAVKEVALREGGLLLGQVVDRQGQAQSGAVVQLRREGRELARMSTDSQGRFAIRGVRGGVYELASSHHVLPIRAWARGSAPPSASDGALLIEGDAVRGQYANDGVWEVHGHGGPPVHHAHGGGLFGGRLRHMWNNPWVWGAGVAAAIAIPIALDDDDAS